VEGESHKTQSEPVQCLPCYICTFNVCTTLSRTYCLNFYYNFKSVQFCLQICHMEAKLSGKASTLCCVSYIGIIHHIHTLMKLLSYIFGHWFTETPASVPVLCFSLLMD